MNDLQPIKDILVCPACRSGLDINRDDITCANCKQVYPIYENIPQFAIEALYEAILNGTSWTNEVQMYLPGISPGIKVITSKFCPIIQSDHHWLLPQTNQPI